MWCTQCKTAFSWATNEVDHGFVHNPHAIQWREEMGLADTNDHCDGFMHFQPFYLHQRMLNNAFERFMKEKGSDVKEIDVHSFLHLVFSFDAMIEHFRDGTEEQLDEVRVLYCLNKISEKKWKEEIFRILRDRERKDLTLRILTSFREVAVERMAVLSRIIPGASEAERLKGENAMLEMLRLLDLCTQTLQKEMRFLDVKNFCLWTLKIDENSARFELTDTSGVANLADFVGGEIPLLEQLFDALQEVPHLITPVYPYNIAH